MFVFRMHGTLHNVFDTAGAALREGRWHSAGTRVIYAAEHASLAVLETLIHAGGRKLPPRVITRIFIPDDLFIETAPWMDMPESRTFGDQWMKEGRSAVLRVPSIAVNRMESNYVFNPRHSDFFKITHDASQPFVFDSRFIFFD